MSCDVTNRQTGAVKIATAEEIKLLVMSKNLAMVLMVVTGTGHEMVLGNYVLYKVSFSIIIYNSPYNLKWLIFNCIVVLDLNRSDWQIVFENSH